MNIKKNSAILTLISLVVLIIGYKIYNKPHVNVANEKADIVLTANAIFENFYANETAANAKYLDKIIQVKGIVTKVENENGIGIITIETAVDFGSVLCHLTGEESRKSKQFEKGQEITLKGICTGFLMDVILVKCIVLN